MENMRLNLIVKTRYHFRLTQIDIFFLSVTKCKPDDDLTSSKHVATIKIASGLLCQQHEQSLTVDLSIIVCRNLVNSHLTI
jgi:hypothetical protein